MQDCQLIWRDGIVKTKCPFPARDCKRLCQWSRSFIAAREPQADSRSGGQGMQGIDEAAGLANVRGAAVRGGPEGSSVTSATRMTGNARRTRRSCSRECSTVILEILGNCLGLAFVPSILWVRHASGAEHVNNQNVNCGALDNRWPKSMTEGVRRSSKAGVDGPSSGPNGPKSQTGMQFAFRGFASTNS